MRLLWLAGDLPYSPHSDGGRAGARALAAAGAEHEVMVLGVAAQRAAGEAVVRQGMLGARRIELAPGRGLGEAVSRHLHAGSYDAIYAGSPALVEHIPTHWRIPIVLDARGASLAELEPVHREPRAFWSRGHQPDSTRPLATACRRAQVVLALDAVQRDALERLIGAPWTIHLVPPAVEMAELEVARLERMPSAHHLLTVGPLAACAEDAIWFLREVVPLLHATTPDLRYDLAGATPSHALRTAATRLPCTSVWVAEDDVGHLWYEAGIFVAPWRQPADGARYLLRAMALGLPVVATPAACTGLDVIPERHVLLGETAGELAAAITRLLADPELAGCLGEQAYRCARERYDAPLALAGLTAAFQHIERREAVCVLCS